MNFFGLRHTHTDTQEHTHTQIDAVESRGKLSLNQVEYFKAAQIEKLSTWPTQLCVAFGYMRPR